MATHLVATVVMEALPKRGDEVARVAHPRDLGQAILDERERENTSASSYSCCCIRFRLQVLPFVLVCVKNNVITIEACLERRKRNGHSRSLEHFGSALKQRSSPDVKTQNKQKRKKNETARRLVLGSGA